MATLRGARLHTSLTIPDSRRDELRRGEPGMSEPGADARYVVTRAGAAAVLEDEDGTVRLSLEVDDPRDATGETLVYLGMREGRRVLAVEVPEPSPEL